MTMHGTTGRPRKLPDLDELLHLSMTKGLTDREIGEMYGVSYQAVGKRLRDHRPERRKALREFPWDILPRHREGWVYEALSFYVAQRERKLTDRERRQLDGLLDATPDGFVWTYNPDTAAGFYLRVRQEGDDQESVVAVS